MSADSLILRGDAARNARTVVFGDELSPGQVLATGPWADSYNEVRLAAHAAGFRQGLDEGRAAGRAEGRHEVDARADAALRALEQAGERLARTDAVTLGEIAPKVVDLALELAGLILQRDVTGSADPGLDALARVLPLAPEHGALVVRLNPDDVRQLGSVEALAPGRELTIVADPALGRGDAMVDAGPCRIDGRLDELMARVAAALRGQEATR